MISKKISVKKVGVLGWLLFLYDERAGWLLSGEGTVTHLPLFFFF